MKNPKNPKTSTKTEFDPATVPPFPQLILSIKDEQCWLDNQQVIPENEETLTEAGIRAAAQAIQQRGLNAARVAASQDDERWRIVVTAEGEAHSLDEVQKKSRPTWLLPLLVSAAALVIVTVVVTAFLLTRADPKTSAPPPPAPQPTPTELPVIPVDGWTTHARWSTPVDADAQVHVIPETGHILTADESAVILLDPGHGHPIQRAPLLGKVQQGPALMTIDGDEAIVAATNSALLWWPVDNLSPDTQQSLEKPPNAELLLTGSSPLLVLDNHHASVVENGTWNQRTIPAGATAVRADGPAMTAVNPKGQIWRIADDKPHVPDPQQLTAPDNPTMRATITGTSDNVLLLNWSSTDGTATHTATVYKVSDGTVMSSYEPRGDRLWETGPAFATSGLTIIDPHTGTNRPITDTTWRTGIITEQGTWGTAEGQLARLTPDGTVHPETDPDAEAPRAIHHDAAYHVTSDGEQTRIYSLIPAN